MKYQSNILFIMQEVMSTGTQLLEEKQEVNKNPE